MSDGIRVVRFIDPAPTIDNDVSELSADAAGMTDAVTGQPAPTSARRRQGVIIRSGGMPTKPTIWEMVFPRPPDVADAVRREPDLCRTRAVRRRLVTGFA